MKKLLFFIICLQFITSSLSAQKVGLVLSGGGAKGITHIGVIKALEENNIPIDYVAGTSMGAIVGGMYAMGITTDEMIAVFKSKDFKSWSTGDVEKDYVYYYRNADPKPKLMEMSFKLHRVDSIDLKSTFLPTNLISPRQMNYAFVPLCAQANAVAGGDFDKLFIPFRCVASDVYNKKAVVFHYGELGDAIRASMTFPFVFKPIVIDNRLLFDGGIFNNFPVDVMRADFKPDFMIGSAVSNNPRKPDEGDIIMQVQNMIMNRVDYSISPKEGLLLHFHMNNVNTFNFSRVDELVQLGYDSTMKHIDELKSRVSRRISTDSIAEKRKHFTSRFPEMNFQSVEVEGVDSLQKRYVEQVFHYKNDVFTLKDFKEAYFKLISDDKILEVIPHAVFNTPRGNFDLKLRVRTQDQLKVLIGGNISSSTSNQAYFGLSYQNLNDYAQTAYIDAQFGRMYNGLGIGTRIEVPSQENLYMKLAVVLHKFDYFEGSRLFYEDNRTSYFNQYEGYSKLSVGFPLRMKGRLEFGVGYGNMTDNYTQSISLSYTNKSDRSIFSLGSLFARVENYTLNDVMYPTKGSNYTALLQLIGGEEIFKSAISANENESERMDLWGQFRGKYDHYIPFSKKFTLGTYAEIMYSSRKLLQNYTVSLIQAPAFQPTPHSKSVYNDAFHANQFGAIGIKPIYHINDQFHVRTEAYWFVPYKTILPGIDNSVHFSAPFSSSQFMAESTLVVNFKIASAGLYVNYYSSAVSQWNFGLNIGFLLFNSKFLE